MRWVIIFHLPAKRFENLDSPSARKVTAIYIVLTAFPVERFKKNFTPLRVGESNVWNSVSSYRALRDMNFVEKFDLYKWIETRENPNQTSKSILEISERALRIVRQ